MSNPDKGDVLEPVELVKQQIGNLAVDQLKNRRQNIDELLKRLEVAETLTRNLPKLVEACDELIATPTEDNCYDVVSGAEKQLARSVRALAKGQLGLAKSVRFMGSFLLPYLSSSDYMSDCVEMANKVGRGQEALRLMAAAKFGGDT